MRVIGDELGYNNDIEMYQGLIRPIPSQAVCCTLGKKCCKKYKRGKKHCKTCPKKD